MKWVSKLTKKNFKYSKYIAKGMGLVPWLMSDIRYISKATMYFRYIDNIVLQVMNGIVSMPGNIQKHCFDNRAPIMDMLSCIISTIFPLVDLTFNDHNFWATQSNFCIWFFHQMIYFHWVNGYSLMMDIRFPFVVKIPHIRESCVVGVIKLSLHS